MNCSGESAADAAAALGRPDGNGISPRRRDPAALADGTTSLYVSTGSGIIGGGFHQAVADATRAFLACVEEHLAELRPDTDDAALPGTSRVIIRALTYQGRLAAEAAEDDLGHGRHSLSPVFHAGHQVITQLRIIDEARTRNHN